MIRLGRKRERFLDEGEVDFDDIGAPTSHRRRRRPPPLGESGIVVGGKRAARSEWMSSVAKRKRIDTSLKENYYRLVYEAEHIREEYTATDNVGKKLELIMVMRMLWRYVKPLWESFTKELRKKRNILAKQRRRLRQKYENKCRRRERKGRDEEINCEHTLKHLEVVENAMETAQRIFDRYQREKQLFTF